ncbi:hypothetical protein ANN_27359 [Periplaneta americana]|uniref:Uncharacterized protein n=1 Tax=Periplaneta americana TaxID=6978 RepID=A0ABQ8RY37_PERAM|nr:hypothetical protein ANN_27359 [Periplaneta americana]
MRILRKASPKSREIAYLTLVRPLMEYGTTCWDPYRIYQINSLERIQYRAAKFVKGKREDGNDTIKELKWETLENRRRKTRITSLYRAHLGQKAWVDITARLEKPTYYGRNDHDFKIKCRKQKTDVVKFRNKSGEGKPSLEEVTGAREDAVRGSVPQATREGSPRSSSGCIARRSGFGATNEVSASEDLVTQSGGSSWYLRGSETSTVRRSVAGSNDEVDAGDNHLLRGGEWVPLLPTNYRSLTYPRRPAERVSSFGGPPQAPSENQVRQPE